MTKKRKKPQNTKDLRSYAEESNIDISSDDALKTCGVFKQSAGIEEQPVVPGAGQPTAAAPEVKLSKIASAIAGKGNKSRSPKIDAMTQSGSRKALNTQELRNYASERNIEVTSDASLKNCGVLFSDKAKTVEQPASQVPADLEQSAADLAVSAVPSPSFAAESAPASELMSFAPPDDSAMPSIHDVISFAPPMTATNDMWAPPEEKLQSNYRKTAAQEFQVQETFDAPSEASKNSGAWAAPPGWSAPAQPSLDSGTWVAQDSVSQSPETYSALIAPSPVSETSTASIVHSHEPEASLASIVHSSEPETSFASVVHSSEPETSFAPIVPVQESETFSAPAISETSFAQDQTPSGQWSPQTETSTASHYPPPLFADPAPSQPTDSISHPYFSGSAERSTYTSELHFRAQFAKESAAAFNANLASVPASQLEQPEEWNAMEDFSPDEEARASNHADLNMLDLIDGRYQSLPSAGPPQNFVPPRQAEVSVQYTQSDSRLSSSPRGLAAGLNVDVKQNPGRGKNRWSSKKT